MTLETIALAISDGVANVTLNRPEAANTLNEPLCRDLMHAAIQCDEAPEVRCVVLTGAGKMFCAGGDLKTFNNAGDAAPSVLKSMTPHLHAAISYFSRMDAPLIVAVNGMAAGGGMSLALSGDIVISAESAKFTAAYTAAGLAPDGSSTFFLPRLVGLRRAKEFMLLNPVLSAHEALEWGLINKVVADAELESEAMKLARRLAQGPTQAYGTVKRLLTLSFDNTLEGQMALEARGIAAASGSEDGREGMAAFVEKRKPAFSGN